MRNAVLILWTLILLGVLNALVWKKEQTATHGRTVLLDLAPRDPRSLMQGDYMTLNYSLDTEVRDGLSDSGQIVLKLDGRGVAKGVRVHRGEPLAADEQLLRYWNRRWLHIGAESFFFQEGDAALYDKARYGELKVDAEGNSVLMGLRDEHLQFLGKPVIR